MTFFIAASIICGVLIFTYYIKSEHFFRCFFKGSILGVLILCGLAFFGKYVHASLPINTCSVTVSAILGLPGVAILLITKYFL